MLIFTNTFGRALFELMGVRHGRKSKGQPKSEARSVVERGLAVVRVYDSLESHWWAIAYPNFAVDGVPTMMILRPVKAGDTADSRVATGSALHPVKAGHAADSRVATGSASAATPSDVVWLEAPGIVHESKAWWYECMDVLGDLSRTAEWHMQLHRVASAITPSSPGCKTAIRPEPMGESKQWWLGSRSVESAAKEPTPDLELAPEDEGEEEVDEEVYDGWGF